MSVDRPRVVIVGAGFGGLAAAQELGKSSVDVTIVDRHNFHTFQPLLYQVATAGLNPADVAYPVRAIFRRQPDVTFRHGLVTGVSWAEQRVELASGQQLEFDHLIVAAGATTNTFGIDGVSQHGFPIYDLADSIRLRNHVLERFEAADADPGEIDRGALTFVVVGGGPTGVELAGALSELFDVVLRKDFGRLDLSRVQVVLVEMLDELLTPFGPSSRRHARAALEARGVQVRTGTTVERVTAGVVCLAGGEEVTAQTLIWAAGVQANSLASALDVPLGPAGRIKVGGDLRVSGRPAFAIGDIAAIEDRRHHGKVLPQLAPVAMQSGRHAARQVLALIDGRETTPLRYVDKGTMATIGRRAAVAELPFRIRLSGTPAWIAWLGLHLVFLVGFRNRLSVFLNWAWNYFTWDRGPRLILRTDRLPDDLATRPPPDRRSTATSTAREAARSPG